VRTIAKPCTGSGARLPGLCLAAILVAGCPQVDRVSPSVGNVGDVIDLRDPVDKSLGLSGAVYFQDVPVPAADILSWSPSDIFLRVPRLASGRWEVRVDSAGVPSNLVGFELLETPLSLRVLCFGDSLTYKLYPGLLQAFDWGAHGPAAVINQGKPGERIAYAASRFAQAVAFYHERETLDFILLMEGTNDVSDTAGVELAAMQDTLMRMIESVPAGVRLLMGTVIPRVGVCGDQDSPTTREWNDWLAAFASSRKLSLVDLHEGFVSRADWETVFFSDTDCLHPNQVGHRRIAELFHAAIQRDLP